MSAETRLACPIDHSPLDRTSDSGTCPSCGRHFVSTDGIWRLRTASGGATLVDEVEAWFDERAEHISDEQVLRGFSSRWHERLLETDAAAVERLLEPGRGDVLLDIGCGNGLFLHRLARRVSESIGVDLSASMLRRARANIDDPGVVLAQAEAAALPIADGSIDRVVSIEMLHYLTLPEVAAFLVEVRRVLRAGGRAFLGGIPLRGSLRAAEAAVGHAVADVLHLRLSDTYFSRVPTRRFRLREVTEAARVAGLEVVEAGTMHHTLPSGRIPGLGRLVPLRLQHILAPLDYRVCVPLASDTAYCVLRRPDANDDTAVRP